LVHEAGLSELDGWMIDVTCKKSISTLEMQDREQLQTVTRNFTSQGHLLLNSLVVWFCRTRLRNACLVEIMIAEVLAAEE
jgi:hypothetical protein